MYVRIPNRKRALDTKKALSYLVWIYPTGRPGVIVSHGITVAIDRYGRLTLRFTPRFRRIYLRPITTGRRLPRRRWAYVAVTYTKRTGITKLYLNNRVILRRSFRAYTLNTLGSPRVGGFSGRIACLQFYRVALNARQIARRRKRCFRGRKFLKLLNRKINNWRIPMRL